MSKEVKSVIDEFRASVNMKPRELESWLKTEESQSVGMTKEGETESVGHKSGKRIIELLQKDEKEYTEDDFAHMKKVVSYIHRHSAQRPEGNIEHTHWCYSLKNWGYDPTK
jgi:DNA topoisomerase VI subunit B